MLSIKVFSHFTVRLKCSGEIVILESGNVFCHIFPVYLSYFFIFKIFLFFIFLETSKSITMILLAVLILFHQEEGRKSTAGPWEYFA